MGTPFRILQKIWGKKKGRRPRNQITYKGPRCPLVWDLFARHTQWDTNDLIHGMSCRPRVSLPFIPSTCLIPTDTSGITTHVRIKNRSIKILFASTFPTPSYQQFIQVKHFALPRITLLKISVFTNPAFINYYHSTTHRVRALHFHRQPLSFPLDNL